MLYTWETTFNSVNLGISSSYPTMPAFFAKISTSKSLSLKHELSTTYKVASWLIDIHFSISVLASPILDAWVYENQRLKPGWHNNLKMARQRENDRNVRTERQWEKKESEKRERERWGLHRQLFNTYNILIHSNPKERQCQTMLKLLHNCTHLTC